jgi:hypothetical protein
VSSQWRFFNAFLVLTCNLVFVILYSLYLAMK